MVQNPSEFRRVLLERFARSPLTIGGVVIDGSIVEEAIEEVIGAMVKAYTEQGSPTSCEKIVGALFVSLIERSSAE
jgi:hypothetical protein